MQTKEKIVSIAQSLIMHYIKQNYSNKTNIEQEIDRVNSIFEGLDISVENKIPGSPTVAMNHGNGKITLRFYDKDNISEKEIIQAIETIIHEIYHSISKRKEGNLFFEEGYVTYITAETVRYAIDNPIDIPEVVTAKELKRLLEGIDLKNGYEEPSEIVRSIQLIMQQYGIDSKYEYIFNGIDRLKDIASRINPRLRRILDLQERKETNSQTLSIEKKFFAKAFAQIDYSDISPTLIEMNKLLQNHLIESGEINRNQRLHDIVSKFNPEEVAYNEFYHRVKNLPNEEIRTILHSEMLQQPIEYQIYEDIPKTIEQMTAIAKAYNESSAPIKTSTFGGINFYSILIAYDILQKGIDTPTEDDIMKYCNYITFNTNGEKLIVATVQNYIEYVREKSEQGKDLKDILNESLTNNAILSIDMVRLKDSQLSFYEKAGRATDLLLHIGEHEYFYNYYYVMLSRMYKQSLEQNHLYDEEDFNEFVNQMQNVFAEAQLPEVMNEIGCTPELMFIRAISESLDMDTEKSTIQITNLLEIIKNRNPNLGVTTGNLEDLALGIKMSYEALQESGNEELLRKFEESLVIAYYNQGYNSQFRFAVSQEIRKSNFTFIIPNQNIDQTVQTIISTPEFYKDLSAIRDMFKEYPNLAKSILSNNGFVKMLIDQLPEQFKAKINSDKYIGFFDINKVVFGTGIPRKENFETEEFKQLSPLLQFSLKYDKYQKLLEYGKKEDIKEFFPEGITIPTDSEVNLDLKTILAMAKDPDVQACQMDAHTAFTEIDNLSLVISDVDKEIS